ncbi:MAG: site-specific integrase [bacterium]
MTTMLDLIRAHLEQYARESTSRGWPPRAKTIEAHRLPLERFARDFDTTGTDPASLSVNFLKDWFIRIGQNGGVSNRNQILSALTEFLRWMVNDNRLSADVLASWQHFHSKEYRRWRRGAPNHKFLRAEQLAALMKALDRNASGSVDSDRNLAFFGLIFFGPSRLGEIRLMDCDHITKADTHFEIIIPAANAKNGQSRTFRLLEDSLLGGADIFSALERYHTWRTAQSSTGPYFVALRGNMTPRRPTSANWHSILKTAANRAGIKATSHYLRHTFGELAASVLDERDLRQIYQHSNPETTRIYTDHENGDRLNSARRRVITAIADY